MKSPVEQEPGKTSRILVVEDSRDQWLLIQKALQQVNPQLKPVHAANQQEAVAILEIDRQNEASFPQLILLDLYLPRRKDGWQTLKAIQQLLPPAKQVPVFILTSSTDLEDVIDANQQGVQSYMVKPKTFPQLLESCKILSDYLQERSRTPWNTVRY